MGEPINVTDSTTSRKALRSEQLQVKKTYRLLNINYTFFYKAISLPLERVFSGGYDLISTKRFDLKANTINAS